MTVSPPTIDGSEILHLLGCVKPCKQWEKLSTSTSAGFLSTVFLNQFQGSFGPFFFRVLCCLKLADVKRQHLFFLTNA